MNCFEAALYIYERWLILLWVPCSFVHFSSSTISTGFYYGGLFAPFCSENDSHLLIFYYYAHLLICFEHYVAQKRPKVSRVSFTESTTRFHIAPAQVIAKICAKYTVLFSNICRPVQGV